MSNAVAGLQRALPNGSIHDVPHPDFRPHSRQSTNSISSPNTRPQSAMTNPPPQSLATEPTNAMDWNNNAAATNPFALHHPHQMENGLPSRRASVQGYHGVEGQLPLNYPYLQSQMPSAAYQSLQQQLGHPSHQSNPSLSTNGTWQDGQEDARGRKKAAASRKRKSSGPTQANGEELKRLRQENDGRSLQEIARQVWRDQEGPRAERSKQVFGMTWWVQSQTFCITVRSSFLLMHPRLDRNVIREQSGSVTRNKVYHTYVKACMTHNIKQLNSASFGKLVHIIFEDLKTRRLGIRGESKYHYVGLALRDDDGQPESFGLLDGGSGLLDGSAPPQLTDSSNSRLENWAPPFLDPLNI